MLTTEILEDPLKFVAAVWPDIRLYKQQAEVLESLRYNYETTVHAANEVGKDFTASIGVVWWYCSRRPARVVTSSSGETQLKSILWTEIRERISTARIDLGLQVQNLRITRNRPDGTPDDLSYVIGHVTKTVENFQGHHLPHDVPRVLAVFDECSGIADEFHTACESWAHAILNIGNPMNTTNYFYRTCKAGDVEDPAGRGGLLSKVIHISGDDSPNVQVGKLREAQGIPGPHPIVIPGVLSYDEYIRRQLKWDKVKRRVRLEGLFFTGDSALLLPPDWLDASEEAMRRLLAPGVWDNDNPRQVNPGTVGMGVDCGAGRDLSCWTVLDRLGVLHQHAIPTPDTYKITTTTIGLIERFKIPPERVCFDAGGGGKQIVDHLRATTPYKNIRSIMFGSSATPPPQKKTRGRDEKVTVKEDSWVYKNKRAEMHGILRTWLDPFLNEQPFAIPEELYQLREDLCQLPIWFDEGGRMFLPPKDTKPGTKENPDQITIKKLIGRSPDRGDSLVLGIYALHKRPKRKLGAIR